MTSASSSASSSASYRTTAHFSAQSDRRPLIDQIAAEWGNAFWLIGRILIGGIFVQSGLEKLTDIDAFAAMLATSGVPAASIVALPAATVEFVGGMAVVTGLATRYAALLMMAFVVGATLISHRFWSSPPEQQHMQMIQFAKNVAILGGFLFVFVTGGGRLSVDRWWHPQKLNVAS